MIIIQRIGVEFGVFWDGKVWNLKILGWKGVEIWATVVAF